jgi:hypothetical protein
MKILVLVALIVCSSLVFGQKKNPSAFPAPPSSLPNGLYFDDDEFKYGDKEVGFTEEAFEVFINDEDNQLATLLDSVAAGWNAKKLTHLEIKWNVDPEADDAKKNEVIQKFINQIPRLAVLKNVSQLKSLSISVGEGLFIKKDDKTEYYNARGQKENLERTFKALTPEFSKLPFVLKVYAENWGW